MNNSLRNEFKEFLIKQGYKLKTPSGNNSTVYDYQKRIDYVCEIENCNWEELATNITTAIHDYSPNGEKSKYGAKSHNAVFSALKQYHEFINKEKNFDIAEEKESKNHISNAFLKTELDKRQIAYTEKRKSFYEINISTNKYILKCRTYNKNYTFVSKSEIPNLADNIMTALVEWSNNKPTNVYLIPMIEWKKPQNTILKDKDYNGLQSQPEWGIDINQTNKEELNNFYIDKIINNIKKNINQKIIKEIEHPQNLETEKQALIKVRIGHSKLKENVLKIKQACDICGLNHPKLLIASNIKPWAKSNDYEKLDCENILLLCPMHDALFDKGLISFDRHGHILISKELNQQNLALMNIDKKNNINITSQRQQDYLDWHRKNIFIN